VTTNPEAIRQLGWLEPNSMKMPQSPDIKHSPDIWFLLVLELLTCSFFGS
jgi:hypothetical protein